MLAITQGIYVICYMLLLLLLCYASWPLYMIAITQCHDDMIICWLAITQGKELLCYYYYFWNQYINEGPRKICSSSLP